MTKLSKSEPEVEVVEPTVLDPKPDTAAKKAAAKAPAKATIKGAQKAGYPSWPSQPGVAPPVNQ